MSYKPAKRTGTPGPTTVGAPANPGIETLFGLISMQKPAEKNKDKADLAFQKFLNERKHSSNPKK